MKDNSAIAKTIRDLYAITAELESSYPGRHFTPDGHLVGSIGEVYAAERYGLELFPPSTKTHDGITPDKRLVQVKTTQRGSVGLSEEPLFLIVLKIDKVLGSPFGNSSKIASGRKTASIRFPLRD